MKIQCNCGQFQAEANNLPKESPGRLGCYCNDCQAFLRYLHRIDYMDDAGCTEIVPVYPISFQILTGEKNLACLRLSEKGLYRWYTRCCNTPIANTGSSLPWVGLYSKNFGVTPILDSQFGPVRCRIMGKYALKTPPPGTADKMNFSSMLLVLPFILKGLLLRKNKNSPFFLKDGITPIMTPYILAAEERKKAETIDTLRP